jgi:hypothetical protein
MAIGDSLICGPDPICRSSRGSFRVAPQEALRTARAGLLRVQGEWDNNDDTRSELLIPFRVYPRV